MLELIVDQPEGKDDIPRLAERLQLEVDDLLPLLDATVVLGFASVAQGDVNLTKIGGATLQLQLFCEVKTCSASKH